MVFLSATEPVVAYGVVALFDPFEAVIGPYLPRMIKTTLLPFKGRIVYDGLITGYNITFGPRDQAEPQRGVQGGQGADPGSSRRSPTAVSPPAVAKRLRREAIGEGPKKAAKRTEARRRLRRGRRPAPAHDRIVALTDAFCREHLDDEYAALCRKLAGVLARKRPSPLTRGKPESWASGIVRVVGWVNFLGDPSQPHHMRMSDIDERFGVSEATGSAKSMAIRNLLKIRRFDPEWTLAQPDGRQPAGLDDRGQRPDRGRPPSTPARSGIRLPSRPDPLYPGRSG